MEYWLLGFCIALLCATSLSTFEWFMTRKALTHRTERYNECVRNRDKIKQILKGVESERDALVEKYNECVGDYNALLHSKRLLQSAYDDLASIYGKANYTPPQSTSFAPVGKNEFSAEELKRIRFAIHPDRNGGKTTELWRKINDMVK